MNQNVTETSNDLNSHFNSQMAVATGIMVALCHVLGVENNAKDQAESILNYLNQLQNANKIIDQSASMGNPL